MGSVVVRNLKSEDRFALKILHICQLKVGSYSHYKHLHNRKKTKWLHAFS